MEKQRKSNLPNAVAARLSEEDPEFVGDTVACLRDLSAFGTPKTDAELEQRIDQYFNLCAAKKMRPGVEALSLALGVDRSTFWRWCGNDAKNKSDVWIELCRNARQLIVAFTEAAMQSGKLSPPTAIFLMKNIASYKDTLSFEDVTQVEESVEVTKTSELPHFDQIEKIETAAKALKMPRF